MSYSYTAKAHDCEMYWDLVKRGIEAVAGLAPWVRLLSEYGCVIEYWCNCDVVVSEADYHKVECGNCCLVTRLKNFSINAPVLEGIPVLRLEHLGTIVALNEKTRELIEQVEWCIKHVFR